MPVMPSEEDEKRCRGNVEKCEAERSALARLSKRCPVIKQANKALDGIEGDKCFDAEYAIDIMIASLRDMPEATATIDLLDRVLKLTQIGE